MAGRSVPGHLVGDGSAEWTELPEFHVRHREFKTREQKHLDQTAAHVQEVPVAVWFRKNGQLLYQVPLPAEAAIYPRVTLGFRGEKSQRPAVRLAYGTFYLWHPVSAVECPTAGMPYNSPAQNRLAAQQLYRQILLSILVANPESLERDSLAESLRRQFGIDQQEHGKVGSPLQPLTFTVDSDCGDAGKST